MDNTFSAFDPDKSVFKYWRHLPHWEQLGATYFVTFRTADSLPVEKLNDLRWQRDMWLKAHPRPWSSEELLEYSRSILARLDLWLDRGFGTCPLEDSGASKIVAEALHHFDGTRYFLDKYVVMPNHAHTLVMPIREHALDDILFSWKSFTANKVNSLLKRQGQLWIHESFDRIMRTWEDVENAREYILN
ncbi:MAG TPA: hypothetical protein VMY18_14080, partial [Acidobacteriota bacterium]|nr:hypothetical protein [Acidobacteriota bacterium]